MTSRWVARGRALPGLREEKVMVRSLSETMRLLARATLKTEGRGISSGGAVVIRLTVNVPGDGPDLWVDAP